MVWKSAVSILLSAAFAAGTACADADFPAQAAPVPPAAEVQANVTEGSDTYRGFTVDNVLHSETEGDIHYNLYVPDSYDGSRPYALFVTLPGYGGLYFQGVAVNLKTEAFGFEAQKYNPEMLVLAPQLSDWRETSANQTIALVEYILNAYRVNPEKVYINGYSGGGETMSLVLEKRPELFAAALHVSSQWDGDLAPLAESHTPVYLVIGEDDEYYGSEPAKQAYHKLHDLYAAQGLAEAEIDALIVLDIKDDNYFRSRGYTNQHGGGGSFAHDAEIMSWLFGH